MGSGGRLQGIVPTNLGVQEGKFRQWQVRGGERHPCRLDVAPTTTTSPSSPTTSASKIILPNMSDTLMRMPHCTIHDSYTIQRLACESCLVGV